MKTLLALTLAACCSAAALAKLPALNDEAKAKAAEAAAKAAYGNKVADFQLCKSMDRVAATYRDAAKKAAKDVRPATETPADAKPPIEAAGAHSPPKTANAPPSTTTPQAVMPAKK